MANVHEAPSRRESWLDEVLPLFCNEPPELPPVTRDFSRNCSRELNGKDFGKDDSEPKEKNFRQSRSAAVSRKNSSASIAVGGYGRKSRRPSTDSKRSTHTHATNWHASLGAELQEGEHSWNREVGGSSTYGSPELREALDKERRVLGRQVMSWMTKIEDMHRDWAKKANLANANLQLPLALQAIQSDGAAHIQEAPSAPVSVPASPSNRGSKAMRSIFSGEDEQKPPEEDDCQGEGNSTLVDEPVNYKDITHRSITSVVSSGPPKPISPRAGTKKTDELSRANSSFAESVGAVESLNSESGEFDGVVSRGKKFIKMLSRPFKSQEDGDEEEASIVPMVRGRSSSTIMPQHTLQDLQDELRPLAHKGSIYSKYSVDNNQNIVGRIVAHPYFATLCLCMILLNCALLAWRVDCLVGSQFRRIDAESDETCHDSEIYFSFFFLLEFSMRLFAERRRFLLPPNGPWNFVDAVLIFVGFFDVLASARGWYFININFLRVFRGIRTIRLIQSSTLMRVSHSLRLMIFAIWKSTLSLVWAIFLLMIFIYIFAMVIQSSLAYDLGNMTIEEASALPVEVRRHYGTLPDTLMSLFMAVTGGRDWWDLVYPLMDFGPRYQIFFVTYISFMVIGVLNVVTGIFVDSATQVSQMDRELRVQEQLAQEEAYMKQLKRLFAEADADKSGTLSWPEFEQHLQDDRVVAYLSSMELDVTEARDLFSLLDIEGASEVKIEDFIMGCMRLKGTAKSIDVCTLLYETRKLTRRWNEFAASAEWQLERVFAGLEKIWKDQLANGSSSGLSDGGSQSASDLDDEEEKQEAECENEFEQLKNSQRLSITSESSWSGNPVMHDRKSLASHASRDDFRDSEPPKGSSSAKPRKPTGRAKTETVLPSNLDEDDDDDVPEIIRSTARARTLTQGRGHRASTMSTHDLSLAGGIGRTSMMSLPGHISNEDTGAQPRGLSIRRPTAQLQAVLGAQATLMSGVMGDKKDTAGS